jgi:hypothetical protein
VRSQSGKWKLAGRTLGLVGAGLSFAGGYDEQIEADTSRDLDPVVGTARAALRGTLNTIGSTFGSIIGSAGGMATGAVCGPAAPACVPTFGVVGAVGGGIGGGEVGDWIADRMFSVIDGPKTWSTGSMSDRSKDDD